MLSKKAIYDRRCLWIAQFAERQRAARQWITLSEIADWCACSVTGASAAAEAQARELAYHRLDQSARLGEFERHVFRGSRALTLSEIRYLYHEVRRFRLEREHLAHIYESIRALAEHCWLPRELVRQWLAAHGYSWPTHFDPVVPDAGAVDIAREPASVGEAAPDRVNRGRPELEIAIKTALKTLGMPGEDVPWGRFCDVVRKECKVAATTRGYGDKSIERGVRRIAAERDKSDIADMSDMSC